MSDGKYLDRRCHGTGYLACNCMGDGCCCDFHGSAECYGCEDCEGYADDEAYYPPDDDPDPPILRSVPEWRRVSGVRTAEHRQQTAGGAAVSRDVPEIHGRATALLPRRTLERVEIPGTWPAAPVEGFEDPAEAEAYRREVEALGQQRLFEARARELESIVEVRRRAFSVAPAESEER